ncbi:glycosyltransferase [Mangrovimonas sp. ST2L15]|uniref:glycosyltransferase family 2 protein n=1 Tax=Mangrovimonas sp. ST2L15 TaxID=1645916 RepID=UPI0006B6161A|nr:glycosyltransferase [Mangrovimonas sp. ST2L15]
MLSILIPTYHYNAFPLASNVVSQAEKEQIPFELLCIDDGSNSELNSENHKINDLKNSSFISLKENVGRSSVRRILAEKAKFDWLLFLDADVIPKSNDFLKNYIQLINGDFEAIFGGFAYTSNYESSGKELRITFGKNREEVPGSIRNKTPYKVIISANFLIKRNIYTDGLNISQDNLYGMDYLFGALLKKHQIKIKHIDNEVYHLGIDSNDLFLEKTKKAVETLAYLVRADKMKEHQNSLLKTYKFLKSMHFDTLYGKLSKMINPQLEKNLRGSNPNLFVFDLYRLGYLCQIMN